MSRSLIVILLLSGMWAGGCGADHINEDEATSGWRMASEPLNEGQQTMLEQAEEQTDALIGGETLTHTVDCETDGEVHFSLSASLETPEDGGQPEPEVDFEADYRECAAEGSTVVGALDIDSPQFAEMGPGGGSSEECDCPEPTPFTYVGQLDFTGQIDGPCEVDMTVEVPPWGQPTYSGDLCGYDASERLGSLF